MSACKEGFTDDYHTTPGAAGWLVQCPNMKSKPGDSDMDYEHYECPACGARTKLCYDEMR